MAKAKTVRLNLILATPKTVEELKQIVVRLAKTPGVIKIEQIFPNMVLPGLAALCAVKANVSKVAAVMTILGNDSDVKSVQTAPLRKARKRKK